jgi:hypothetical protein
MAKKKREADEVMKALVQEQKAKAKMEAEIEVARHKKETLGVRLFCGFACLSFLICLFLSYGSWCQPEDR